MKLMTGILAVAMMTGGVCAQNPNIINNVKGKIDAVQQKKADDSDAVLSAEGVPATAQATKPAAGSPGKAGNVQPVPVKPQAVAVKPAPSTTAKPAAAAKAANSAGAKPAVAKRAAVPAAKNNPALATTAVKPHDAFSPRKQAASPRVAAAKLAAPKPGATPAVPTTKIAAVEKTAGAGKSAEAPKPEGKKWAMSGKRDPFFSPVVQQTGESSCSTGKKCLEIGQINVRGVVKSESGFIAVVTNSLNKAYFLHENDPVFNGYVVRITGDSVVFQETVQDKLGKPLTREVVKRLLTPAV